MKYEKCVWATFQKPKTFEKIDDIPMFLTYRVTYIDVLGLWKTTYQLFCAKRLNDSTEHPRSH
jgi:hypothetical protein